MSNQFDQILRDLIEEKNQMRQIEIQIIKELTNISCPNIPDNITKLIDENVDKIDENSQKILRCVLKYFFSRFPEEEIFNLPNPVETLIKLLNTKIILGAGVFGTTVLVGLEDSKPFTVMKFSDNKITSIHELATGLLINSLRNIIPNFVYTYGGIICKNPTNVDTLEGLCEKEEGSEDQQSVIIFTEYVPGLNFNDFFKSQKYPFEYIFNLITQVIYSIIIAYQRLNFMHNDLHYNNIKVRETKYPINLEYQIDIEEGYSKYKNFECETNHISVIFDFGVSIYTYKNMKIGPATIRSIKNELAFFLEVLPHYINVNYGHYIEKLVNDLTFISLGEFLKRWFEIKNIEITSSSDIVFPANIEKKYEDYAKIIDLF